MSFGTSGRIDSMDQFRGYTVAGMFVVNFLGGRAAVEALLPVLSHHNTYFSYADSIMPAFLFACGFSYRLTMLRRIPQLGAFAAYRRIVVRSLALVLVSLVMYGFNIEYKTWDQLVADRWEFFAKLLKANLWETLAIIGVTQILILPFVAARAWVRVAAIAGFAALHVLLSYSFNFDFVYGRPNWLDRYWGAAGETAWDGGFFGNLTAAIPMLCGTLVYDLLASRPARRAVVPLLGWGALVMALGYGLSCLTTLYDVASGDAPAAGSREEKVAASPVWPPLEKLRAGGLKPAEPPFVPPPPPSRRQLNYWMMSMRVSCVPIYLFASGFALACYALFVWASDVLGLTLGVFRTFGQNPLAAYIIHHSVEVSVHNVVPKDSPLWWCLVTLAVFFGVTYLLVRYLERHNIYLRL